MDYVLTSYFLDEGVYTFNYIWRCHPEMVRLAPIEGLTPEEVFECWVEAL